MHKVSVVIPAYKAAATIERAILSALGQPKIVTQVIVVVDGHCAETEEILKSFADPRVTYLVNDVNSGAQVSRNRGLDAAIYPMVMFLDADDYLTGDLLCGLADCLTEQQADVVFGPWIWLDESANLIRRNVRRYHSATDAIDQMLLGGKFPHPSATLWAKAFVSSIGGWDVELARFQDAEIALRAVLLGAKTGLSTSGAGVYVQYNSGDRITGARKNAESLLIAAEKLLTIDSKVVAEQRKHLAIAGFLHNIGSSLQRSDRYELGQKFMIRARELGWNIGSNFSHPEARNLYARQIFRRLRKFVRR